MYPRTTRWRAFRRYGAKTEFDVTRQSLRVQMTIGQAQRIPGMTPATTEELVKFLSELTEEEPEGGDAAPAV